jgi:xanthine dehydrogenase accessory factor
MIQSADEKESLDMENLYGDIAELLEKGESLVVASIFDTAGSTPRTTGAKMVIRENGSILGTIGGGRLEADAIRLAGRVFSSGKAVTHAFDLASKDAVGMDMICGGRGEILVDFIDTSDKNAHNVFAAASGAMAHREKAWFITVLEMLPGDAGLKRQWCLVKQDGTLIGEVDCDPYLMEKLIAGPAKITIHSEAFDRQRFLVEPLRPASTVYIFGAGHVSQEIAPLADRVGFRTIVLDDRTDYANRERFPASTEIMLINSFSRLPQLNIDEDSYLVIVTRGHLFDKVVLEQVLRTDPGYIGMIGSCSKRDLIFQELIRMGYGKPELDRVYSPIGTNIGAETPQEIAVSIVGELIKVRSEKELQHQEGKKNREGSCCAIQP